MHKTMNNEQRIVDNGRDGRKSLLICSLFIATSLIALSSCTGSADAWSRVQETSVLRVGMDASFPPFEYVDETGVLTGFDVELAREIAARMGGGTPFEVQFVANFPYDGLYDALSVEQIDVAISALYVDAGRMADFAYSASYFNAGQVLVAGDEQLAAVEDLAGRTLAVEFGGAGDIVARAWQRRLPDLEVLPCSTADAALGQVVAGAADAALVDQLSALAAIGAGRNLVVVGSSVTDEPYAVAVRRQDRALLRAIDEALATMAADGTLAALQQRWFGASVQ